ncbi:MAG TPA: hypothetical protein VMT22_16010 [Terriglobales bacterium]|jgi:hypothetical protein|nr:hypothetical protein [Terriglobales bacterium]
MLKRLYLATFSVSAALLAAPLSAMACTVCAGGASDATIEGYNASVLFLMATPYLVMGSIAGGIFFTYRRALKKRAQAEAAEEPIGELAWNQEESAR